MRKTNGIHLKKERYAMPSKRKNVIELKEVTAHNEPRYDAGLTNCSLRLLSGEAVILTVPKTGLLTPLADLCCGLEEPASGIVHFLDIPWPKRSAVQTALARGRIGRVWADSAWIGNLDIDENIVLPQMHHTYRSASDVRKQAVALARSFGLDDLPHTRPATTPENIRQKAQWVRALTGTPELLLLEYPDDDCGEADHVQLAAAVDQARTNGTAVLWITAKPAPVLSHAPGTVRLAELTDSALIWQTQESQKPNFLKG